MREPNPGVQPPLGRMEKLRTERLLLRRFDPDTDFEAVHAYASDAEVTKYMDWGPNTPEMTRAFLAAAADGPQHEWEYAIEEVASGVLVGGVGIHLMGAERADIGYCLTRQAWGRGIATEAASVLLRHAFDIGVHRVQAGCHPENAASIRVLSKLGMRLEGRMRECIRVRGEWQDQLVFAVLRSDPQYGVPNDRA
jgi:[ribosomal protein S5]-alanine N-acetyltransferase